MGGKEYLWDLIVWDQYGWKAKFLEPQGMGFLWAKKKWWNTYNMEFIWP